MVSKNDFFHFFYCISSKLPDWLFKFNQGTIFSSNSIKLRSRENSNYSINRVTDNDINELAQFSSRDSSMLSSRLKAGDIGIISREIKSNHIKSIQWAHTGNTYIRGLNLKLIVPDNTAYIYWAYSSPDVRITGIINNTFKILLNHLDNLNINRYCGFVEFWNEPARKYHLNMNFHESRNVLYLKLLFIRITFSKDVGTQKMKCNMNLSIPKNTDII